MRYEKAKDILPDDLLKEVQKYAAGRLLYIPKEWLHSYLLFTCKNKGLSEQLLLINRYYIEPVKFPLKLIHEKRFNEEGEDNLYRTEVDQDIALIQDELPPLLIHYEQGSFFLDEDLALFHDYKHKNVKSCTVIIWITEPEDYEQFMKQFGTYLSY